MKVTFFGSFQARFARAGLVQIGDPSEAGPAEACKACGEKLLATFAAWGLLGRGQGRLSHLCPPAGRHSFLARRGAYPGRTYEKYRLWVAMHRIDERPKGTLGIVTDAWRVRSAEPRRRCHRLQHGRMLTVGKAGKSDRLLDRGLKSASNFVSAGISDNGRKNP
jgi:hypothetical protein